MLALPAASPFLTFRFVFAEPSSVPYSSALVLNSSATSVSSISRSSSKFKRGRARTRRHCANKGSAEEEILEEFSVLSLDVPWDTRNLWTTFAAYLFSLHIPLSFGGLSIVAYCVHQPDLDPFTKVLSLSVLQAAESFGVLALLHYTAKPNYEIFSFFIEKLSSKRSSLLASTLGIGFLLALVILVSLLADKLIGPKDINNTVLKDILSSGLESEILCFFLYCFLAPFLEEIVYRGFLLTSLTSMMKWWQAVILSSFIFSIAHFSAENSVQLFLIGCVLGSVYCWTGNLISSFSVHFAYNAIVLLVTVMS